MHPKNLLRCLILLALLAGLTIPLNGARASRANQPAAAPLADVSAYELIATMNALRVSYGNPALVEDPIINAVAQATAEIMAANQMSWHIGDVRGRLAAAGYGGGATVWGTENFAVGTSLTIDDIMVMWADPDHMIPAVKPAYCHVGAGVAKSANGMTYYVLQAAYTATGSCGPYSPGGGTGTNPTPVGGYVVPGIITPVEVATPDADGKVYHEVKAGQSFWSIAVAYKVTIKDIETWNNISKETKLQVGQKLFIPGKDTEGYATPTPIGMVQVSQPDADGKIVHEVQAYQTLSTISQAYGVTVDTVLGLNGLQVDWALQIGQKLVIKPAAVTPSPTPRPLTPVERLTPAADGKYYHTVQSGETLAWIAGLYEVQLRDLMGWNGLGETSILQVNQKLVLQVTPPATVTPTPGPPTSTPTATQPPATATQTRTHIPSVTPTGAAAAQPASGATTLPWVVLIGVCTVGLVLVGWMSRKQR